MTEIAQKEQGLLLSRTLAHSEDSHGASNVPIVLAEADRTKKCALRLPPLSVG